MVYLKRGEIKTMSYKVVKHADNKDEAVSPVVGVMLMLVVTVVLAAVVTVFATGVVDGTEVAPISLVKVNVSDNSSTSSLDSLTISVYGGDAVDLSKVRVIATYDDGEKGVECVRPGSDGKSYLSVGQKVNVLKEGVSTIEPVGFDDAEEALEALAEQDLIHVMIVYNNNTILYEKNLRIE